MFHFSPLFYSIILQFWGNISVEFSLKVGNYQVGNPPAGRLRRLSLH
ncbi:MAG: hypothetical protein LBK82_16325 [Planctomycetaceae bacterium]|nr:hypothetical protein [Planctomycetaceae bacterium]